MYTIALLVLSTVRCDLPPVDEPINHIIIRLLIGAGIGAAPTASNFQLYLDDKPTQAYFRVGGRLILYIFDFTNNGSVRCIFNNYNICIKNDFIGITTYVTRGPVKVIVYITAYQVNKRTYISGTATGMFRNTHLFHRIIDRKLCEALLELRKTGTDIYRAADSIIKQFLNTEIKQINTRRSRN